MPLAIALTIAILGFLSQLAIVALAVSERRRRRRAEPVVVYVILVVVSEQRQRRGSPR